MPGSYRPISSREEHEWAAYEHVFGPLGLERLEGYLARLAYYVVATTRTKADDVPPLSSFVEEWDSGYGKPIDEEAMLRVAEMITATHGGEDRRPVRV